MGSEKGNMASKQPATRKFDLTAIASQILILLVLAGAARFAGIDTPLVPAALSYLILSIALRKLVPGNHRRGVAYLRADIFDKAIEEFGASYRFFERHSWLDRFRYLTLFSSSRVGYREMALLNSAYCYARLGDDRKVREYYEKTLKQFPESEIAKSALQMFDAAQL